MTARIIGMDGYRRARWEALRHAWKHGFVSLEDELSASLLGGTALARAAYSFKAKRYRDLLGIKSGSVTADSVALHRYRQAERARDESGMAGILLDRVVEHSR